MKPATAVLLGCFLGCVCFIAPIEAEAKSECGGEAASPCLESLLPLMTGSKSSHEMCNDLSDVTECFLGVASSCNIELDTRNIRKFLDDLHCSVEVSLKRKKRCVTGISDDVDDCEWLAWTS